jgi:predicted transcriptional regulator YheO
MDRSEERKIIMNSYLNIMDFLSQAYGSNCEIVLHSITGRSIKSNTYYIKDSTGVLIGILCINFDITAAQNAVKSLEEFMGTTKSSGFENDKNASGSINSRPDILYIISKYALIILNQIRFCFQYFLQ